MSEEIKSERKAIQALIQAGDFGGALSRTTYLLEELPEDTDLLYMAAVAARYAKRFDDASRWLEILKGLQPEFGRAFQEEGHLLRDQGKFDAAIILYKRACQYNPSLESSWRAQADILARLGRPLEAESAIAQADRLKSLPGHIVAVSNHLAEGRLLKAEDLCRAFLQKNPQHVEAMRLLADIGSRLGVLEDADTLLEAAIGLEPDNIQIRLDYIHVLRKRQKFAEALAQAKALFERDPENPVFASHYAIESMQTGEYDRALGLFENILTRIPGDPATLTSQGHALKTAGYQDKAIASYREAVAAHPDYGDAWYALANLKTYRFSDDELAAMTAQVQKSNLTHMSRVHFCFALGKAYEDLGAYDEAFSWYARGNELKRAKTRYTTQQIRAELEAQKRLCTGELFAHRSGAGCESDDPIFIVGLPRAGSTLIEQILASHSQVDGTLELPNILSLAHRLRGRKHLSETSQYPQILYDLPAGDLKSLGQEYIDTTRIHRKGAPFFTDKMPNNFRHLGLIHLILPNAKIIDARRDPLDCCWSGFKQLFAEGQEFTYSLEDIGHYYREYVDLMDHWDNVFPEGRILRVQHEKLIDDFEAQVRRLLEYCGLEFEEACLEFYKTDRAVRTASSEQVRQPISRAGQGNWKPFQHQLAPLREALGLEQLTE
ncbi:MAG: sulfotransferase [Pseudomonadota bacterium]